MNDNESEQIEVKTFAGGAVKARVDGHVGGYLVLFSDEDTPDLDGDFFTKDTDFGFEPGERKKTPVWFNHRAPVKTKDGKTVAVREKIGEGYLSIDSKGVLIDAILYEREQYEEALEALGWSSGTAGHLVNREPRKKSYFVKTWLLGLDASLTPRPAEPNTRNHFIKSIKLNIDDAEHVEGATKANESQIARQASASEQKKAEETGEKMTDETKVEEAVASDATKAANSDETLELLRALKAQNEALAAKVEALEKQPINSLKANTGDAPAIVDSGDWKYDNVKTSDLAFMIETLAEAKRTGRSKRGANPAAYKSLARRLEGVEAQKDEPLSHAVKAFKSTGLKANEINQSTLANYGDEWVGVAYSGSLWEAIRHETMIVSKLPSIEAPPGAESIVIPLESTDPTWYKVAQSASLSANPGGIPTNTVTASNLGTGNQTMNLAKQGARVLWTGELEEDSVLPYVAQLRRQLTTSGAEYLESAVIDGDTATGGTTNINDIAGTPGGTEYWLNVNGFRKLALVTNTANSRDAGALTSADYLETVKLMGVGGANAADINRVAFIVGPHVWFKSLELSDVKTRDVNSAATIENGRLVRIWGYDVMMSYHMHKAQSSRLANAAGKIDLDTAGNNTTGSILAVRWDQWWFGWRRRMTIETTRVPAADATEIVALMRYGLIYRDNEASAISYNVTV